MHECDLDSRGLSEKSALIKFCATNVSSDLSKNLADGSEILWRDTL